MPTRSFTPTTSRLGSPSCLETTCSSTSSSATRPTSSNDGGFGTSAAPIYQLFVEQAKKLEPRFLSMVIPSRWFAGGKGLDDFREAMLGDDRVRSIDDYLSGVGRLPRRGAEGRRLLLPLGPRQPGPCRRHHALQGWAPSTATRPLLEEGRDVFIRFNEGLSILKKVVAVETGQSACFAADDKRFDRWSARKPFGLGHDVQGQEDQEAPAT